MKKKKAKFKIYVFELHIKFSSILITQFNINKLIKLM